jgi:hypothetical protein
LNNKLSEIFKFPVIVNESTDAIDYYDGFGTTELVVGIRAYQ